MITVAVSLRHLSYDNKQVFAAFKYLTEESSSYSEQYFSNSGQILRLTLQFNTSGCEPHSHDRLRRSLHT